MKHSRQVPTEPEKREEYVENKIGLVLESFNQLKIFQFINLVD